jgi:hypothetical protein
MDINITLPTRLCGTDQQEMDNIKRILDFRSNILNYFDQIYLFYYICFILICPLLVFYIFGYTFLLLYYSTLVYLFFPNIIKVPPGILQSAIAEIV